jgi:hypothetical protein
MSKNKKSIEIGGMQEFKGRWVLCTSCQIRKWGINLPGSIQRKMAYKYKVVGRLETL